jgi:hypothetical protein
MGNLSFEHEGGGWKKLLAGYPFRLIRSSRGVLNCQLCLDFDQGSRHLGSRVSANPESRSGNVWLPGSRL